MIIMKSQKLYSKDEDYWDKRAYKFGEKSEGQPAICSYGMPDFYNQHIDRLQRRLMLNNLDITPNMKVLDAGCGVGRWTSEMAKRGASVTGVDISQEMIDIAQKRVDKLNLSDKVNFKHAPLHLIGASEEYDLVICVTVIQHIEDQKQWEESVLNLLAAAKKGGKIALLEVAPTDKSWVKIPSRTHFKPRQRDDFVNFLKENGAHLILDKGMDFLPLKYNALDYNTGNSLTKFYFWLRTIISEPVEYIVAPTNWGTIRSWHRLMVFEKE